MGEATKESVVCGREQLVNGNSQSMSMSRMVMANDSTNFMKAVPCLVFFHISSGLLIGYCKSNPQCKVILVCTACLLKSSCGLFRLAHSNFRSIRAVRFYRGSRWILSRRQHAPNKQCALINDVHLITRFYGICLKLQFAVLVISGWLVGQQQTKVVWRSARMVCGELSVMTSGQMLMPTSFAVSWVTLEPVSHAFLSLEEYIMTQKCHNTPFVILDAIAYSGAFFGLGSGPIHLDDVACTGSEAALVNCTYDTVTTDCSHFEDAGVQCQGNDLVLWTTLACNY